MSLMDTYEPIEPKEAYGFGPLFDGTEWRLWPEEDFVYPTVGMRVVPVDEEPPVDDAGDCTLEEYELDFVEAGRWSSYEGWPALALRLRVVADILGGRGKPLQLNFYDREHLRARSTSPRRPKGTKPPAEEPNVQGGFGPKDTWYTWSYEGPEVEL